jgi:hypothetical protein
VKRVCQIFVLALASTPLFCGAQSGSEIATTHPRWKKFLGSVSQDGQSLLCGGNHLFVVSNPEVLAGHSGHRVSVKGSLDPLTHLLKIASVKVIPPQTHYSANLGDAAFRR